MRFSSIALTIAASFLVVSCTAPDPRGLALDAPNNQIDLNPVADNQLEQINFSQGDIMQTEDPVASPYLPTAKPNQVLGQADPVQTSAPAKPDQPSAPETTTYAIATSKGTIVVTLYPDDAPRTVANFVSKAASGYYAGLTFHRVEPWVIQGGDPLGNGTGGGPLSTELSQRPFSEGSLGVARGGNIQVSNDSQFFICLNANSCGHLTGQYTHFGQVVEGMEVARSIEIGDTIQAITPAL